MPNRQSEIRTPKAPRDRLPTITVTAPSPHRQAPRKLPPMPISTPKPAKIIPQPPSSTKRNRDTPTHPRSQRFLTPPSHNPMRPSHKLDARISESDHSDDSSTNWQEQRDDIKITSRRYVENVHLVVDKTPRRGDSYGFSPPVRTQDTPLHQADFCHETSSSDTSDESTSTDRSCTPDSESNAPLHIASLPNAPVSPKSQDLSTTNRADAHPTSNLSSPNLAVIVSHTAVQVDTAELRCNDGTCPNPNHNWG